MAIIGSSLDPQQQNLDMLNTLGSVVSSNVDIKKSIDTLRATISDASNKEQTESARLRASIDRSVNSIAEYFRGQISADLIQKSDTQSRASSVLGRSAGTKITSNAKAADKEVTKLSADAKETSKNMMEASRNFTGSIKELVAVIGNRNFFSNSSSIDKFVEDIKNGKITGLNTFSKGIGVNPKTLNKDIVVPLIHGIIKEIKTGQDFQTAIKNATLTENATPVENDLKDKKDDQSSETPPGEDSIQENVKAIRDGILFMTKRYKSIDKSDLWKSNKDKKKQKSGSISDFIPGAVPGAVSGAVAGGLLPLIGKISVVGANLYLAYAAGKDLVEAIETRMDTFQEKDNAKNRAVDSVTIGNKNLGGRELYTDEVRATNEKIKKSGGYGSATVKEMDPNEVLKAYKLSLIERFRYLTLELTKKYMAASGDVGAGGSSGQTKDIIKNNYEEIQSKIFMYFHKAIKSITCDNNGGLENAMLDARKLYLETVRKLTIAFSVMTKNANYDKSYATPEDKREYLLKTAANAMKPMDASEASNHDEFQFRALNNQVKFIDKKIKEGYKSGDKTKGIELDEKAEIVLKKEPWAIRELAAISRRYDLHDDEYQKQYQRQPGIQYAKFDPDEVTDEEDVLYGSSINDRTVRAYRKGLQTMAVQQPQNNNTSQTDGFANSSKLINDFKQEVINQANTTNKQSAELLNYLSISTAEQRTTNRLLEQLIGKPTVIAPGPRRSALPTIMNNSLNGGIQ